MLTKVDSAVTAYKLLNGVFCVYKPSMVSFDKLREMVLSNLCNDLNRMKTRPLKELVVLKQIDNGAQHCQDSSNTSLSTIHQSGRSVADMQFRPMLVPNFADHPLIVGPRYQIKDFEFAIVNYIGMEASGITLCGIREQGAQDAHRLHHAKLLREYEILAELGYATDTGLDTGQVIERSTYKHLRRSKLDLILSRIQQAQQKALYRTMDLKTQAAYKAISSGLVKPIGSKKKAGPIVYNVRCTKFAPPELTFRITVLNENNVFLRDLVNGIGLEAGTNAVTKKIRCITVDKFCLDDALTHRNLTIDRVLQNIIDLRPRLEKLLEACGNETHAIRYSDKISKM